MNLGTVAVTVLSLLAGIGRAEDRAINILVAASAKDAVAEIANSFTSEFGTKVKIASGASSALCAQILADAPADLFLPASQEWSDAIAQKGLVERSQPLLTNQLVLVVPKGNPAGIKTPADLIHPRVRKIALAGENVPAGKYAQQALRRLKLYDELVTARKIARGQDVRIAMTYVELGEAEAGVVYRTDARLSAKVEIACTFSPETHERIVYPLILLKSGQINPAAVQLYNHLASAPARSIFEKFGFARSD